MDRQAFREKVRKEIQQRRANRMNRLQNNQEHTKAETLSLAGDFADDTSDIVIQQMDDITSALPETKQHGAGMQMLRETKRSLMVEEQLRQAQVRANEKNQTGASLAVGMAMDSFSNWMSDGFDRAYANRVVSEAIKES